jgi:hypothetical protein
MAGSVIYGMWPKLCDYLSEVAKGVGGVQGYGGMRALGQTIRLGDFWYLQAKTHLPTCGFISNGWVYDLWQVVKVVRLKAGHHSPGHPPTSGTPTTHTHEAPQP